MPLRSMETDENPFGPGGPRTIAGRARLRVAPPAPPDPPARPERVPILIAAASAALGAGLEGWLTTADPDWSVHVVVPGRAGLAGALHPGLALVVATIAAGGESLVFAIRDVAPAVPVLALCERADPAYEAALLRAGASGAIAAGASRAELVRAVREMVAGRSVMSAAALRLVAQGPPAVPHLTGRQRDVLRLMAEGRSTREIAQRLVIAQSTVKTHIARLSLRLELTGRGEMQRNAAAVLALAERGTPAPGATPGRIGEPPDVS